jgi:hypothetical protein
MVDPGQRQRPVVAARTERARPEAGEQGGPVRAHPFDERQSLLADT